METTYQPEPRLLTPQQLADAIGGRLLVKVPLEVLWAIRERADAIRSHPNVPMSACGNARKIIVAVSGTINDAITKAIVDLAEREGARSA